VGLPGDFPKYVYVGRRWLNGDFSKVAKDGHFAGVQSIASEVMEVFSEMPSRCRMLNRGGTLPADNGGSW